RKGFVDGRTARLPTVIVRPGRPNAATTSCFSGVIREPLQGEDAILPVARTLPHSVTSTRALIYNLVTLHNAAWPPTLADRSANLPSRPCTLQQLVDALYEVVPEEEHSKLGKIIDKEDKFLSRVVGSMGSNLSYERARELKMVPVPELKTVIEEFLEDFGEKSVVSRKRRKTS
ncbi:denD, partial [Symbiodinium pilosum]